MRLSAREQDLLRQLHTEVSIGDRLFGNAPDRVAILREIASSGNVALIAPIGPWVLSSDARLASAAAAAVDALIRGASDDALAELDDWSRRHGMHYGYPHPDPWRMMKPETIADFRRFVEYELSVVGVVSFHPSGWLREAAIRRLDELRSPRAIPFFLLRVGDWVTAVSDKARAAFERHIVPGESGELLAHVPLLVRVTARQRRDTSDLRERVFALLRDDARLDVLAKARRSDDQIVRRVAFRLSVEGNRGDRVALLSDAVHDPDTAIRLEAIVRARDLDHEALRRLLPAFLADAFPKVRLHALALSIDALGADSEPFIRSALVDDNQFVRTAARHAARECRLVTDFITFYRECAAAADSPRRIAAAIRGFAEVGSADHALTVVAYLAHDEPRVRAAAVEALARLDESTALERLPSMLADPSPRVSHAVRDSLRPLAGRIEASKLATLLDEIETKHGRRDAFLLSTALSKWDALPLLIECAADADEEIRAFAQTALLRWLEVQNRTFVQPTRQQVERIKVVLELRRLALQRSEVDELRSILRFWGS